MPPPRVSEGREVEDLGSSPRRGRQGTLRTYEPDAEVPSAWLHSASCCESALRARQATSPTTREARSSPRRSCSWDDRRGYVRRSRSSTSSARCSAVSCWLGRHAGPPAPHLVRMALRLFLAQLCLRLLLLGPVFVLAQLVLHPKLDEDVVRHTPRAPRAAEAPIGCGRPG